MSVVVFLGPPGVGKGTQAGLIHDRLGALHISTGALLREQLEFESPLSAEIREVMARGDLVSDDQLFGCLQSKLDRIPDLKSKLVLLDGVPRTRSQVSRLDAVLLGSGLKVDLALSLSAPVEKLVRRFEKRWSCKKCGSVYALDSSPEVGFGCDRCGEIDSLVRRKDDEPGAVRHRFKVFEAETAPLIDLYLERGLLREVDGLADHEVVFDLLKTEISKLF